MFKKELLVGALVVTFCLGFIGTAIAGSAAFDESQIETFVQAETDKGEMATTESKEFKHARYYAPAGAISNLDHTTAELDAKLEAMVVTESKKPKHSRYYAPAGAISNLDHTTAELDAKLEAVLATESKDLRYIRCSAPAGAISNLDHTTAELDAKLGC